MQEASSPIDAPVVVTEKKERRKFVVTEREERRKEVSHHSRACHWWKLPGVGTRWRSPVWCSSGNSNYKYPEIIVRVLGEATFSVYSISNTAWSTAFRASRPWLCTPQQEAPWPRASRSSHTAQVIFYDLLPTLQGVFSVPAKTKGGQKAGQKQVSDLFP